VAALKAASKLATETAQAVEQEQTMAKPATRWLCILCGDPRCYLSYPGSIAAREVKY
jgi:hypothetical protein